MAASGTHQGAALVLGSSKAAGAPSDMIPIAPDTPGAGTSGTGMPRPAAAGHGIMKKKFHLYNTVTANKTSKNFKATLAGLSRNVHPRSISYETPASKLPKNFDPRSPDMVPKDQQQFFFYSTDDKALLSILCVPLDQAGCGSCWAFAAASMYTDRIRTALLRRYGSKACFLSQFFTPINACTGETGLETAVSGIVNAASDSGSYTATAVTVRDRISDYYTVAFAPKMRDSCPAVGFETCTQSQCALVAQVWQGTAPGGVTSLGSNLGSYRSTCMGCEGNHIAMALTMYAGGDNDVTKGAPTISAFPLQDWVCLFGDAASQKSLCPPQVLKPVGKLPFPSLYRCDMYGYNSADEGVVPPGITSMEEWFRAEIYSNGPIMIGYTVYQSFMDFFTTNPKSIYRAKDFLADIKSNPVDNADNSPNTGGHAVTITGWGEEVHDGALVKYWVIRNSWGTGWGDEGYFRVERMMDKALAAAGVPQRAQFENEFGRVYFAPQPNVSLYKTGVQNNPMLNFLTVPPANICPSIKAQQASEKQLKAQCTCQSGYIATKDGNCVKQTGDVRKLLGESLEQGGGGGGPVAKWRPPAWAWVMVFVFVLCIVIALVVRGRQPPLAPNPLSVPTTHAPIA